MRPIFLVIDPPDPESLSTRKLVLETAKFNVLTAFSAAEALEVLERVSAVDAVVAHTQIDGETEELAKQVKRMRPELPVIIVSPRDLSVPTADCVMNSHDPVALVTYLTDRFGKPTPKGERRGAEIAPSQKT